MTASSNIYPTQRKHGLLFPTYRYLQLCYCLWFCMPLCCTRSKGGSIKFFLLLKTVANGYLPFSPCLRHYSSFPCGVGFNWRRSIRAVCIFLKIIFRTWQPLILCGILCVRSPIEPG